MLTCAEPRTDVLAPVLDEALPDPYVHKDGSDWYVFGTGTYFYHGEALSPETMRRAELELDFGTRNGHPQDIWGFFPYRDARGDYHAYCTLHYGNFRTVVAHFRPQPNENWRASRGIRRWRLDNILAGSLAQGRTTYYDPKVLAGEDGQQYLVYCAAPGVHRDVHIMAHRMLDPGRLDPADTARPILSPQQYRSEDRNPGYIQLVEGPNIFKLHSKYLLLYSVGDFTANNYKLGIAYSDSLIPPAPRTYEKILLPDIHNVWGNTEKCDEVGYLLQSEAEDWPNYCGDLVSGPGWGNIVETGGRYWLVFHGYRPEDRSRKAQNRHVWMLPLEVRASDSTPVSEWIRPVLGA